MPSSKCVFQCVCSDVNVRAAFFKQGCVYSSLVSVSVHVMHAVRDEAAGELKDSMCS